MLFIRKMQILNGNLQGLHFGRDITVGMMLVHCNLHLTSFQLSSSKNAMVGNVADVVRVNIKIKGQSRIRNTWFVVFGYKYTFIYLFQIHDKNIISMV